MWWFGRTAAGKSLDIPHHFCHPGACDAGSICGVVSAVVVADSSRVVGGASARRRGIISGGDFADYCYRCRLGFEYN
jgi:hypothetical protein